MAVGRRLDQLGGDPHPVALAAHRSFHDRVHAQLARDLRNRLGGSAVGHGRGAGGHAQGADLAEVRDHRLGESVREVVLGGISRNVGQRQHDDGPDGAPTGEPHQPVPSWAKGETGRQKQSRDRERQHAPAPRAPGGKRRGQAVPERLPPGAGRLQGRLQGGV